MRVAEGADIQGAAMRLIECAPNVSEGRDLGRLQLVAEALKRVPGVTLLDWSADPDHNRSVFTYVGAAEAVFEATQALCRETLALVDMRQHHGAHPRLGAVDVIPFIPLRGVTKEEAIDIAKKFSTRESGAFVNGILDRLKADLTRPSRTSTSTR